MDGTRSALIIASSDYTDPGLRRLRAPASDAEALAGVLRDPQIGGFEVRTLLDEPAHEINLAVEEFFADRRPDDLLLVHISCHGVKDESGDLYFAAANTRLSRLGATAVAAEFVNRRMSRSRSRRVVLLLDCCYAGAFERGMTARAGTGVSIEEQFGGRGRAVITASSAMEYAFEGDELADVGEVAPSVFTSALVEGLETGEADRDQDGMVALDELYDYVYDRVREATPNQTPGKWTFGVQGDLYIARRSRPVSTPTSLPPELQQAVDSPFAAVRAGAVQELLGLLESRHAGMQLAARLALERLTDDDSRRVGAAAAAALSGEPAPPPTPPPPPPVPAQPIVEAARPPAATASVPGGPDRRRVAGGLAIASAALSFLAVFLKYQYDDPVTVARPGVVWYVLLLVVLVLGAGVVAVRPGTPAMIGPGLLLGIAPLSVWGLVSLAMDWASREGDGFGPGFWLGVPADTLLGLAACLAGLALAADPRVRWAAGRIPWAVVLLGLAGGAVLFLHAGLLPTEFSAPLVWAAGAAFLVPLGAALVAPRRLAAAILVGWIGSGAALCVYYLVVFGDVGTARIWVFALTLLALLIAAGALWRSDDAGGAEPHDRRGAGQPGGG